MEGSHDKQCAKVARYLGRNNCLCLTCGNDGVGIADGRYMRCCAIKHGMSCHIQECGEYVPEDKKGGDS